MSTSTIKAILAEIERLLGLAGDLPAEAELAIEKLLNMIETLTSENQSQSAENQRLKQLLDEKKKSKTTAQNTANPSRHSSEKRRRQRQAQPRPAVSDRRTFKALTIHATIPCPVDPATLPPDAVRLADEAVIVQDIQIKPRNIRFLRSVHYSPSQTKYFRGPLPGGYDAGDFGADLRALILSLKYCGNMSEPKIREFLENFDVRISAGSVSNILTKTADSFADEFDQIVNAGLASTAYQQTDDTSARVGGKFWHTHILCNPFYAAYFTRPRKDRLAVLEVLQNTSDLRFQLGTETIELLQQEFELPEKWRLELAEVGEAQFDKAALSALLEQWFGDGNGPLRTAIEHASAIVFYRHQTSVPRIETLVCDDAGQFKLLTERLALCWIHAGRHYEKLSPVVPGHQRLLAGFLDRYWDYYQSLQRYRAAPTAARAEVLRDEFDAIFSTRTGFAALDSRIAKTAGKKAGLLTVLAVPSVPLHNNASELQARVSARRRDVSLHSRSAQGARAMDIFTTIVQTAKLQGISAYAYFQDRIRRNFNLNSLALYIQNAASG